MDPCVSQSVSQSVSMMGRSMDGAHNTQDTDDGHISSYDVIHEFSIFIILNERFCRIHISVLFKCNS